MKAGCFSVLFQTFPNHQYLILDVVYDELRKHPATKAFIDKNLYFFSNHIKAETFAPKAEYKKEYFKLQSTLGRGESACMVYCWEHNDVLGSSNLRDIKSFCAAHGITYLTTLDFLYHAYTKGILTKEACTEYIEQVNANGSRLPIVEIDHYVPNAVI
ncbi:MAG: hypothetical protein LUC85_08675 [Bacteroidales bacterium]|nr:hypothetical protein [Bacteroidales bacterium]